MKLCARDWVEVRSKKEILATLDKNGRLEGMPFMPEMFKWCGQRFQVYKRAHKSCDTVTGNYVNRLLPNSVHLDLRCDGSAHGGCQAACLIFWKQAWLKPIDREASASAPSQATQLNASSGCTEANVVEATQAQDPLSDGKLKYVNMSKTIRPGTTRFRGCLGFAYFGFIYGAMAKRHTIGRPARWVYDRFQDLPGGIRFPRKAGLLASGKDAPTTKLDLQRGDFARRKELPQQRACMQTAMPAASPSHALARSDRATFSRHVDRLRDSGVSVSWSDFADALADRGLLALKQRLHSLGQPKQTRPSPNR